MSNNQLLKNEKQDALNEMKNLLSITLTSYNNYNFEENIRKISKAAWHYEELLGLDTIILRAMRVSAQNYIYQKNEDNLYLCKDELIKLWNHVLSLESEVQ